MTSKRRHRFLLVNPWIHDFAAFDYWAKPLGLLFIAAVLRKEGFAVDLIDCLSIPGARDEQGAAVRRDGRGPYRKEELPKPPPLSDIPRRYSRYGMSPDDFRALLTKTAPPDAVLVTSVMTYWYPGVFEAIDTVKKVFPGVPVALGGIYATLCPEHARAFSRADLVVEGDVLLSGSSPGASLQGVLETLTGEDMASLEPVDGLAAMPYPACDLLPAIDQVPLLTSRGCPYSCSYCASRYLEGPFRSRPPRCVADEISFWFTTLGIRHFSFYDDALMVDAEHRLVPLLEEVVRRKLPCRFHCPNGMHLRGMNEHIADMLYRAGFRTLRFGFETSRVDRQCTLGGKISNAETQEAVSHLKRAGFRGEDIGLYLLCGLPGQDCAEVSATVDFVLSLGVRPVITEYSPIPHTPLWEEARSCSPYDLASEPLYHNNSIFPCLPDAEDRKTLQSLKIRARRGPFPS